MEQRPTSGARQPSEEPRPNRPYSRARFYEAWISPQFFPPRPCMSTPWGKREGEELPWCGRSGYISAGFDSDVAQEQRRQTSRHGEAAEHGLGQCDAKDAKFDVAAVTGGASWRPSIRLCPEPFSLQSTWPSSLILLLLIEIWNQPKLYQVAAPISDRGGQVVYNLHKLGRLSVFCFADDCWVEPECDAKVCINMFFGCLKSWRWLICIIVNIILFPIVFSTEIYICPVNCEDDNCSVCKHAVRRQLFGAPYVA
jgi:hypothetical protein